MFRWQHLGDRTCAATLWHLGTNAVGHCGWKLRRQLPCRGRHPREDPLARLRACAAAVWSLQRVKGDGMMCGVGKAKSRTDVGVRCVRCAAQQMTTRGWGPVLVKRGSHRAATATKTIVRRCCMHAFARLLTHVTA